MQLNKYACCFLLSCIFSVTSFASTTEIHQHKSKEISKETPVPKIELTVFRDMMDGVNIHIDVENYVLNAPNSVLDKSAPENGFLNGHAHVFINGGKRQRLYGSDIHIPNSWLKKGVNQVAISLNSHQHENWTLNKQNIVGSVFFDLSKKELVLHNFTSQPIENKHAHH